MAKSDSKLFRPDQKNERRDISVKKKFWWTLTDDARHKNKPPLLDFTRIFNSYHKRNDRRKFPEKQERPIPHEINHAAW